MTDPQSIADKIDGIPARDPEWAHGEADAILLANVDPLIADAYRRLVNRCHWWATA